MEQQRRSEYELFVETIRKMVGVRNPKLAALMAKQPIVQESSMNLCYRYQIRLKDLFREILFYAVDPNVHNPFEGFLPDECKCQFCLLGYTATRLTGSKIGKGKASQKSKKSCLKKTTTRKRKRVAFEENEEEEQEEEEQEEEEGMETPKRKKQKTRAATPLPMLLCLHCGDPSLLTTVRKQGTVETYPAKHVYYKTQQELKDWEFVCTKCTHTLQPLGQILDKHPSIDSFFYSFQQVCAREHGMEIPTPSSSSSSDTSTPNVFSGVEQALQEASKQKPLSAQVYLWMDTQEQMDAVGDKMISVYDLCQRECKNRNLNPDQLYWEFSVVKRKARPSKVLTCQMEQQKIFQDNQKLLSSIL